MDVLDELIHREQIILQPGPEITREDLDRLFAAEYQEIGASGRTYSRVEAIEALLHREPSENWHSSEFSCLPLSPDVYLTTYALVQDGGRRTRRTSIWRRSDAGWQIVFHQGTLLG